VQRFCTSLDALADATVDVVFASNVFEHLPSKQHLLQALAEARRVLRPGGRLLILQPNIRYAGGKYWDYFDHHLPLTERSLVEALAIKAMVAGYPVGEVGIQTFPPDVRPGLVDVDAQHRRDHRRHVAHVSEDVLRRVRFAANRERRR